MMILWSCIKWTMIVLDFAGCLDKVEIVWCEIDGICCMGRMMSWVIWMYIVEGYIWVCYVGFEKELSKVTLEMLLPKKSTKARTGPAMQWKVYHEIMSGRLFLSLCFIWKLGFWIEIGMKRWSSRCLWEEVYNQIKDLKCGKLKWKDLLENM